MKKTFLLGVGCQKGGTTWLYKYLNKHPGCELGFQKEYHVFDALHIQQCSRFMEQKVNLLKYILDKETLLKSNPNLLKHIDFYRDTQNYYNYFNTLHHTHKASLVGDITPSYAGLPNNVFSEIKSNLENLGFNVKVVFIMRDPVERIWSQVRMGRRQALYKDPSHVFERSEEEAVVANYQTTGFEFRTQYEKTMTNLEKAFTPDQIHYEFFENLFKPTSITALCSFLNIDYIAPNYEQKVNVTTKEAPRLSDQLTASVARHYEETYRFCFDRFGESFIRDIWPNAQSLK